MPVATETLAARVTLLSIEILLDTPLVTLPNGKIVATYRSAKLAELLAAAMTVATDEDGDLVTRYSIEEHDVAAWLDALDGALDGLFEFGADEGESTLDTLRSIVKREAGHRLLQLIGRELNATQAQASAKLRGMDRDAAVALLAREFGVDGRPTALADAILPRLMGDSASAMAERLDRRAVQLDTDALDSDRYQGQVRTRTRRVNGPPADVAIVDGIIA